MNINSTRLAAWRRAALLCGMLATVPLMTGCLGTTVNGDAGCLSYAIARETLPRPVPDTPLGQWVADTDVRMTGTCT